MTSNLKAVNAILDVDFNRLFNIHEFMYTFNSTNKEFILKRFRHFFENNYNKNSDNRLCGEYFNNYYNKHDDRHLCKHVMRVCNTPALLEMGEYITERYRNNDAKPRMNVYVRVALEQHITDTCTDYIYLYLKQTKYPEFIKQIEHYCDAEAQPKKTYENEHIE